MTYEWDGRRRISLLADVEGAFSQQAHVAGGTRAPRQALVRYDATYVGLAEMLDCPLITEEETER